MQYKCKVTVIRKHCFTDLQETYLADPKSGECPFYQVGNEYLFTRYGDEDTFWTQDKGSQCSEAWDCISRYIYTALQGGAIMRGWTNDPRLMIACCNDGTRPVVFKIERLDYKAVVIDGLTEANCGQIQQKLEQVPGTERVVMRPDKGFAEVFVSKDGDPADTKLTAAVLGCGAAVTRID